VGEYIRAKPPAVRDALARVRSAIRRAVPEAEERISYGIPAYMLHGSAVLYFAGWKQHYSLYPARGPVAEAFKEDLAGYEVENATIRFPLAEPVPSKLIERIAAFRAKQVAGASRESRPGRKRAGSRT
jgi:uncharacterized protein YdhG (YjbR/CyaY superfamily)